MNELCSLWKMSCSELAAWVQAVGSIIAILAAGGIAGWQARKQHESALAVLRAEQRAARLELSRTFLALCESCLSLLQATAAQLPDREAIHNIGDGHAHLDLNELHFVEGALHQIPVHGLPNALVPVSMMVTSTVKRFREEVEAALTGHRHLDGSAFAAFFRLMASSQTALRKACQEISAEVRRVQTEA